MTLGTSMIRRISLVYRRRDFPARQTFGFACAYRHTQAVRRGSWCCVAWYGSLWWCACWETRWKYSTYGLRFAKRRRCCRFGRRRVWGSWMQGTQTDGPKERQLEGTAPTGPTGHVRCRLSGRHAWHGIDGMSPSHHHGTVHVAHAGVT
jgi:hypothetical protein